VLLEAGNLAREAGDFERSRPLLDEAVERARTALGPLDEESARAYNCLGLWGRYRGDLDLARQAYTSALRILEQGPRPQLRANILHNLASLEHLAGHPELALELIDTTLSLRTEDTEADAVGREGDDGVRAAILIDLGRYPEAGELFRSLSVRLTRRWGADSTELMHLNANWAVLEQHQGDLVAARTRYADAIAAAERLLGPDSAQPAVIYANAAHLAFTCGDRDTAAAYAHHAVHGLEGWASEELPSLRLARQVLDALDS
jgi:tetratricopeptide (TPR) repeat protein